MGWPELRLQYVKCFSSSGHHLLFGAFSTLRQVFLLTSSRVMEMIIVSDGICVIVKASALCPSHFSGHSQPDGDN